MRKYHFISGLPRSGSTLLSAILKQNPKFTTGISDPLHSYVKSIIRDTGTAAGMEAVVDISKRRRIIHGLFDSFYSGDRQVCFNTNRAWTSDTALLKDLYPEFKMIVCLRDIPWILDSFEVLNSKNPYTIKPLYHHQDLGNVYDRCHMLMGNIPNFAGYVGGPLSNVRHSVACAERHQILYVEYDHLVSQPAAVVEQIYAFLGEPLFKHDFNNVEDSHDEFDAGAKIDGLHKVRRKIQPMQRRTVLPEDLWNNYSGNTFWKSGFEATKKTLNWSLNGLQARIENMPVQINKIQTRLNRQL